MEVVMAKMPTTKPEWPSEQEVKFRFAEQDYTVTMRSIASTTVAVPAPAMESTKVLAAQVRDVKARADVSGEFARFTALAKGLAGVSKRDLDLQRRAEKAAKDPRIQAALAAAALRGDETPDDPKGLDERLDRLNRS